MGGGGFLGIGGWEFVVLLIVFLVIVGPQRLPEYTQNIIRTVRRARKWVDENRSVVENEMGIAVEDLKKYDPRQYDPRRIIREAWGDTTLEDLVPDTKGLLTGAAAGTAAAAATASSSSASDYSSYDEDHASLRAPFDPDAT